MDNWFGTVTIVSLIALAALIASAYHLIKSEFLTRAVDSTGFPKVSSENIRHIPPPTRGTLIPAQKTDLNLFGNAVDVLESAALPVVIDYFPLSDLDSSNFDLVPVSPVMHKAMLDIVKAAGTKGDVLYRVILPKGAELVKAAGKTGFRGFSRTGGKTAHAVLKPVVVGGAAAISWPVVAVTGTLLILDGVAQHQQRIHQNKVETILTRQESRYFEEQLSKQRAINKRITREVLQLLDGKTVSLEESRTASNMLFNSAQQFLHETRVELANLPIVEGIVDFRKLGVALGGKSKDLDYFLRRLNLAQSAIALEKRAVVAYAAAVALGDEGNPYSRLRMTLNDELTEIDSAEVSASDLTEMLMEIELTGNWFHKQRDKVVKSKWSIETRQAQLRERLARLTDGAESELQFILTSSGDLKQLVKKENERTDFNV